MSWLKRKKQSAKLPRQLALGLLEGAMGQVQPERYRYVRTRAGRIRHLEPLEPPGSGPLCGWPGADAEADPSLPVCRLCEAEALAGEERAAS